MSLLKINNLHVAYGKIPAVTDLSFAVNDGQIVALVGANGAGKSTVLKTIVGVVKPISGSIFFSGTDITSWSADRRVRAGIVLVPEGRQIFTTLSVYENLLVGAYHRRDEQLRHDFEWVYTLFPVLKERAHQTAGTLSGGEQQMLALGRALMARPRLLLLDEPSLGLAPLVVREIYQMITNICKTGITVLLVEQNINIIIHLVDYVYVMQTGELKLHGTPQEVFKGEDIKRAYLGG
jgi:branched-chain amino acid transport system ATP-binding protein